MNMQEMRGGEGKNKAHIEHGSNTHTCSRRRFGFKRFFVGVVESLVGWVKVECVG